MTPHRLAAPALLSALLVSSQALAHHPTGGETPATLVDGFLSGLGHPVIGLDHLAMVLAVGLAAAFVPAGFRLALAFVAATLGGVALHLAAVSVPAAEILVALSVVLVGALIAGRARLSAPLWAALFALAGLLHGYAFGEAVVGAETTPLAAYLVSLGLVQLGVAEASRRVARRLAGDAAGLRTAGGAVLGAGLVLAANLLMPV